MAKYGIKGMIGGGAAAARCCGEGYTCLAAGAGESRQGNGTRGDLIIGFSYHIADTEEKAIEEASNTLKNT